MDARIANHLTAGKDRELARSSRQRPAHAAKRIIGRYYRRPTDPRGEARKWGRPVVQDGALPERGMPRFDKLDTMPVRQIYAYYPNRGQDALDADAPK
jgi:hypothetical protein